ncbi:hypothetical protein [Verrucomicrobium sp. GAS474]|uniref:hypothetical protein n=1 Tax=Verrucomicrobium sp. GAS474 TaxID=1882831 RepID=UPI0012FFD0C0|nr:hypothetical protein [Verrucomicrobium sp. GAS474]
MPVLSRGGTEIKFPLLGSGRSDRKERQKGKEGQAGQHGTEKDKVAPFSDRNVDEEVVADSAANTANTLNNRGVRVNLFTFFYCNLLQLQLHSPSPGHCADEHHSAESPNENETFTPQ